ncbi:plasma membrane proteolipid Pmp3 [Vermiconidia calcicola]|uniref:Plasma membrane proteolipid Pmp3 n=1 Tax=Vermiconidia calcicola TaxID=1690605 RepID=A0ACC3MTN3_9PEZI|nr:plasma membrane proteolipid Pmp3 [Vermiconidia calcicola]
MLGGLLLAILALFLPPLTVVLRRGVGADLLINILLTCLAWLPGVLHAWYIIVKTPNHRERHRVEKRVVETRPRSRSRSTTGKRSHDGYTPPPMAQHGGNGYYGQQTGYAPAPARKY